MKANIGKNIKDNSKFEFKLKNLVKHFVAFGGSGSGKTVLSKVMIEEAALNGVPSILIDPQGDLSSLAVPENEKFEGMNVAIFTPASSKGIPMCINPLRMPEGKVDKEELINIFHQTANSIASLIGYDLDKDKGKHAQAILYYTLHYCYQNKIKLNNFNELINILSEPDDALIDEADGFIDEGSKQKKLLNKLKFLTVGEKDLLFNHGVPLDIGNILNKNTINIIYLNSLSTKKDKEFFISMLALQLYEWMLKNPSMSLQALFYIDEIAEYMPAGAKKPVTKDILKLIYKQARKYGLGCMVSTQNPGDIDYKALAQFGTWAIGRLTTKQDREKVKDAMKSLAGNKIENLILKMPKLKPGEFLFFCPDEFDEIQEIKSRWLYTIHETLTEHKVKELMKEKKKEFSKYIKDEKLERFDDQVKRTKEDKKGKSNNLLHWKIVVKEDELDDIIKRKKKKSFLFFGPEKESLVHKELLLRPMYRMIVESKSLLKKEKEIYIDAVDGNIVSFNGEFFTILKGANRLMGLNDTELAVMKLLSKSRKGMTNKEISKALRLTGNYVNKVMNDLMKDKLIAYSGKKDNSYVWQKNIEISFNTSTSKASSRYTEINSGRIKGKRIKDKIEMKGAKHFVKYWFDVDIKESQTAYYPAYQVTFSGKKERIIYISAVNGKEL